MSAPFVRPAARRTTIRPILTITLLLALAACTPQAGGPARQPAYTVFFSEHSSQLEPQAVDVIAQAASAAKAAPAVHVMVLGYTDSAGSKPDDVVLSRQRAQRVADALTADGVPAGRIAQQGRGQTGQDPGVESRRVDITLGN